MVIGILEHKQSARKIEEFARKIGYEGHFHGEPVNTHIWLFWRNYITITDFTVMDQSISCYIQRPGEIDIKFTMVYAKCNRSLRLMLWDKLRDESDTTLPWLVGGDFNTILKIEEKKGGRGVDLHSMQDFRECAMDAGLSEIEYEGDRFTWCNNQQGSNRLWERLDRIFRNGEAFVSLPALKCSHLNRISSDHSPLLLTVAKQHKHKSRFIFQKMWLENPEFHLVVQQVWQARVVGTPSFRIAEKLRWLQRKLKSWNWEVFGDIRKQLEETGNTIERIEADAQLVCTETGLEELRSLKEQMAKLLRWEADLLYQKTRDKWLIEGDRNTKFFHALIKDRRICNTIKLTQPDGTLVTDNTILAEGAVNFFHNIFSASPYVVHEELFQAYPKQITEAMNRDLEAMPSSQEVRDNFFVVAGTLIEQM